MENKKTSSKHDISSTEVEKELLNIDGDNLKNKYHNLCRKYLTNAIQNEQVLVEVSGVNNYGGASLFTYNDSIINIIMVATESKIVILGTSVTGSPLTLYEENYENLSKFSVEDSTSIVTLNFEDGVEFSIMLNDNLSDRKESIDALKKLLSNYCKVEKKRNLYALILGFAVLLAIILSFFTDFVMAAVIAPVISIVLGMLFVLIKGTNKNARTTKA